MIELIVDTGRFGVSVILLVLTIMSLPLRVMLWI